MKIKLFVAALLCSFLAWQLNTMVKGTRLSYSHPLIPGGSYRASCNNISMNLKGSGDNVMRVITAECLDVNGNPKKASISLPLINNEYLDVTLENVNGELKSFQPQLQ